MEYFSQYFLLWAKPEFLFFILLLGYLFVDQTVFRRTIILLLLTCAIGSLLKTIWKIPLNSKLASQWWAYPSGHTQFCVVMWCALIYQLPKKWLLLKKWLVLPLGLYFMVEAEYHDWPEVFGGICSGIIITCCYIYMIDAININERCYRIGMFSSQMIIYLYLVTNFSHEFSWLAKLIGLMVAICIIDSKTDYAIKHTNLYKKFAILIITLAMGMLSSAYIKPIEFKHIIKFADGLLLGLLFFYAMPTLLKVSQSNNR